MEVTKAKVRVEEASYYSPLLLFMASHTVEEIFNDYTTRRTAIVHALTQDVDEFYGLCNPGKDKLCLYGHPNETWEVRTQSSKVPQVLPEPTFGINFARDDMDRKDWLSLVGRHSDSWLLSVAFYLGDHLNCDERENLFSLINDLPTILKVVTDRKPIQDKPTADMGNINAFLETVLCGCCGGNYNGYEFWIGCDICETWYHGKCIMLSPAKAETLKQFKCPPCAIAP